MRIDGAYHRHDFDTDFHGFIGSTRTAAGVANGILHLGRSVRPVRPYLSGGIGVYRVSEHNTVGQSKIENSSTRIAFNAGVGMRLRLTGLNSFLEGRLHEIPRSDLTSRIRLTPITAGLMFDL